MALIKSYEDFLAILQDENSNVSKKIIEDFKRIFKTPLTLQISSKQSIKYIEFDSSFRNRNLYPIPSTFVVEMSQSIQGDRFTAQDPVCDSSPVLIWNNSFVEGISSNTCTNITISPLTLPSLQGDKKFKITTDDLVGDKFRQVINYYVGSSITITNGGITVNKRIIEYLPINLHTAIITLESSLPDSVIGLSTFHIDNPTPINTGTPNSIIKVFVPGSNKNLYATQKLQTYGLGESNYYVGYYMQSEVDHLFKKIISFDATTRLATLDSDTGITDWASAVNIPWWGKNFTIRKELSIIGRLDMLGPNAFTPSKVRLDPKIVNPGVLPLTFSSTLSDIANYYVGYFLRVVSIYQTNGYPSPQTEERRIVEYDPTTYTFTVYPPFSSANLPFFPGLFIEILPFTRDNATQFNFTGPIITSDQTETYEVELINLILPNTVLVSGRGGRAIFYPYFYVELRQLSTASSQTMNVIFSNNPNSSRMLFRAVVDDTPIPAISPFIKIDGDGMAHTLRIKPNDTFRFSVFHPNGELFKTEIEDTFSPTAPNPLAQISACFSFKKIL